jgi:predicted lipid-binding transport protein (Tim44 family)
MSATSKRKGADLMSLDFNQIIARFIHADPKEVAEALASDVMQSHERARADIEKAKREIENGARPKKGRFRL